MQAERRTIRNIPGDDESPQVHAEISAVRLDERLLPIYEEQSRHSIDLEQQKQSDSTTISLQLIADKSTIAKRGQLISGGIALVALIGGLILVAVDKEAVGSAVLVIDAVFLFSQKLMNPGQSDIRQVDRRDRN